MELGFQLESCHRKWMPTGGRRQTWWSNRWSKRWSKRWSRTPRGKGWESILLLQTCRIWTNGWLFLGISATLSGFSIRFLLSVVELHGRFLSQAGGRHELAEGEELIFENAGWRRRRRSRRRQLGMGPGLEPEVGACLGRSRWSPSLLKMGQLPKRKPDRVFFFLPSILQFQGFKVEQGWGDPDFLKGWKMNFHFGARSAFEK